MRRKASHRTREKRLDRIALHKMEAKLNQNEKLLKIKSEANMHLMRQLKDSRVVRKPRVITVSVDVNELVGKFREEVNAAVKKM